MEIFNKAFRDFQETGGFIWEDAPVTLNQLRYCHGYIKRYVIRSHATISRQFSLKNIASPQWKQLFSLGQ